MVSGTAEGTVRLWDRGLGTSRKLGDHAGAVTSSAISADGRRASPGRRMAPCGFGIVRPVPAASWDGTTAAVGAASVSDDGAVLTGQTTARCSSGIAYVLTAASCAARFLGQFGVDLSGRFLRRLGGI